METHTRNLSHKTIERIAQWLLVGLILLLPFQTRWIAVPGMLNGGPWEYGTVSLYAIDFLLCAVITCGIFFKKHRDQKSLTLNSLCVIALLVIAFFSLDEAVNRINGLFWYIQLLKGALLFFAIRWIRPRARPLLIAWVISGVMQSIVVHVQILSQRVVGNTWLGMASQDPATPGVSVIATEGERFLRAYGTFPHPNIAGIFLAIACVITLILFVQNKHWQMRLLYGISLLATSSALFFTFSRQAWVALAVMCIALLASVFWTEKKFPALLTLAMMLSLLPAMCVTARAPELVMSRVAATERIEQQSIDERSARLQESATIITTHWFTGVGIGNYTAFLHAQDQQQGITKESFAYQPVHMVIALVFVELGVLGLVIYLLFLTTLFVERRSTSPETIVWSIVMLGLFVAGLFDHYLWSLPVGIVLFWMSAGLLIGTSSRASKESS